MLVQTSAHYAAKRCCVTCRNGLQSAEDRGKKRSRASRASHYNPSQLIRRTPNPKTTTSHHMRVEHRGPQITVPEQLLNRANISTRVQQMRRKTVAQRMTACALRDPRLIDRTLEPALHCRLAQVMPPPHSLRIDHHPRRRKHVPPVPILVGPRVLPPHLRRKTRRPNVSTDIPPESIVTPTQPRAERPDPALGNGARRSPTTISRRSKSRSFTRNDRHSISRSPPPYINAAHKRTGSSSFPRIARISRRLRTVGTRFARRAG
jgi:hypothetical protein